MFVSSSKRTISIGQAARINPVVSNFDSDKVKFNYQVAREKRTLSPLAGIRIGSDKRIFLSISFTSRDCVKNILLQAPLTHRAEIAPRDVFEAAKPLYLQKGALIKLTDALEKKLP
jgi:hypothetical protein